MALAAGDRRLLPANSENVMAVTLATIAVLGFILFGVIPFGYDWALAFKTSVASQQYGQEK
jgi:hypothetical protein